MDTIPLVDLSMQHAYVADEVSAFVRNINKTVVPALVVGLGVLLVLLVLPKFTRRLPAVQPAEPASPTDSPTAPPPQAPPPQAQPSPAPPRTP